MELIFPDYYKEFQCIADRCEDTCCAGWEIVIDPVSERKYKQVKGTFRNRLENSITRDKDGDLVFEMVDGRCTFLNEKNLCDIYSEIGKQYLCKTCRRYPRHVEEFEDLREISLSMSCPEAARIILRQKGKVRQIRKTIERAPEEYEDFDYFLFTKLLESREAMIGILQNRTIEIKVRMKMVLALAHDLQTRIQRGALFEIDGLLERYTRKRASDRFKKRLEKIEKTDSVRSMQEYFGLFDELEMIQESYHKWLKQVELKLKNQTEEKWEEENSAFEQVLGKKLSIWLEQVMVYFISTYYCGAVYDERAFSKVKLAYLSTFFIKELAKKRKGDFEQMEQIFCEEAYRYCREVEHSSVNLNRMEKAFREKAFSLEKLMCLE